MKPVSGYVSVTDINKSLAFYSDVFQRAPAHVEERYSFFDLDGFSFGLYNAAFDHEPRKPGNNCVICFKVADLEAEYDRLKSIVSWLDPAILTLPTVRLFQCKDLDGNLIEFFQENK